MKKIVILGSTGSVGKSALDVVEKHKNSFRVLALTAHTNAELLAKQAKHFNAGFVGMADPSASCKLRGILKKTCKVFSGAEGIKEIAGLKEADMVLVAISGTSAIGPLIASIKAGKRIALANKESIVSAGKIIIDMAKRYGADIIPVDSEHSSIFQCIRKEDKRKIRRIFLMGSGGPLKDVPKSLFKGLTLPEVLKHPVWKMGRKITVDSATMMNKGLEAIEASRLFGIDISEISILLHPEAAIHSMVEFKDGNVMANLFYPDMRIPIFYAFTYPDRQTAHLPRLNLSRIREMTFRRPDKKKFPAIETCYEAAKRGGTLTACLNSANEEAVRLYLEGKIGFTNIAKFVKSAMKRHRVISNPSLSQIFSVDAWAKEEVRNMVR